MKEDILKYHEIKDQDSKISYEKDLKTLLINGICIDSLDTRKKTWHC
jgi:hypothetical protein